MTLSAGFLLFVLMVVVFLFLTEKLPIDLTAVLALAVLVVTGLIQPKEAFAGFSSSAVIVLICTFIISAGFVETGLADRIGELMYKWSGQCQWRAILAVIFTAAALSSVMANVAVTVILMPAVAILSQLSGVSPSRLFIPLSFAALLGGTSTLIGTAPNILTNELMVNAGIEPFKFQDFLPLGIVFVFVGALILTILNRIVLPSKAVEGGRYRAVKDLYELYKVEESLFTVKVPVNSPIDGQTIGSLNFGATLALGIVAIIRNGRKHFAPAASDKVHADDTLIVRGNREELERLLKISSAEPFDLKSSAHFGKALNIGRLRIGEQSCLIGQQLKSVQVAALAETVALTLERSGSLTRTPAAEVVLEAGDILYLLASDEQLLGILADDELQLEHLTATDDPTLAAQEIFVLPVNESSPLANHTLADLKVPELIGLSITGILREGQMIPLPPEDELINAGDELVVVGDPSKFENLKRLRSLELAYPVSQDEITAKDIGVVEVALAPRSELFGHSLVDLNFREQFGVQVLSVWRAGEPIKLGLRKLTLEFGDALLLMGPYKKLELLNKNSNFVLISDSPPPPRKVMHAPTVILALFLLIVLSLSGLQPPAVAAFLSALVILGSGAISMPEAYRNIDWRIVVLVGSLLPIGQAIEHTGLAQLLTDQLASSLFNFGPIVVLACLMIASSLISQLLDGTLAVVLLVPLAMKIATQLAINPKALGVGVAIGASIAFLTPFSHRSHLLVMAPGGYRKRHYFYMGLPLTIALLIISTFLLPLIFPF